MSTIYHDLLELFGDWRQFQPPLLVDGVPDYGPSAMASQHRELAAYRRRLAAIDPSRWPIPQQVDYHVVRAEMNGLDFDHHVLRPWANDPAFYVTVFASESDQPAREGHYARGSLELWSYAWPLDTASAAEIRLRLGAIPPLLDQARRNLVGTGRDLWISGARLVREQGATLERFGKRLTDPSLTDLRRDVERARAATESFASWVNTEASSKNGPSGVGIDHYDWYLRNVQLLPYTWHDELTLMQRELARAWSSLTWEESRNAGKPPARPIADAEEYAVRAQAGVTDYVAFLSDHDLLSIHDDMEAALRARVGRYSPPPRSSSPRSTTTIRKSCVPTGITGSTRRT